jgi:cellulose synthase/poly-beta-1,6-N-acetylglucosamine synthase-like glycosyltransferase
VSLVRVAELTLWLCAAAVVYGYVVYPIAIWLLAACFGRRRAPGTLLDDDELPRVSLLVAAHNEELTISDRVANALTLDYPYDKLEIVVASDGSSDRTAEIVRACGDARVRLLDYPNRRGKASVLNAAFRELTGDIVVLSDANTLTDPAAIRNLVRWFRSPEVGVVCGRLVLTDPVTGSNVDSVYWKYETFLKKCESRLGALLGANGAIYAIRRSLFSGIRRDMLIDDFVIPLVTRLRTRCAIVYDADAVAREETPAAIGSEFVRRARIGTGGFQSVSVLWKLLNPAHGWIAFTFLSHKIVRWLCPFFLIGAFASNLVLINQSTYAITLAAQSALYLVAAVGTRSAGAGLTWKMVRLTTLFAGMNLALLVGFYRWLTTEPEGAWSRTLRQ